MSQTTQKNFIRHGYFYKLPLAYDTQKYHLRLAQGRTSLWAPTDEPPTRLATAKPDNLTKVRGWQGKPKENRTGGLTGDVAGSLYVQPGALKQRRCGPFALFQSPYLEFKEAALLPNVRRLIPFNQWQTTELSRFALTQALARYASEPFFVATVHSWF